MAKMYTTTASVSILVIALFIVFFPPNINKPIRSRMVIYPSNWFLRSAEFAQSLLIKFHVPKTSLYAWKNLFPEILNPFLCAFCMRAENQMQYSWKGDSRLFSSRLRILTSIGIGVPVTNSLIHFENFYKALKFKNLNC